MEGLGLGLGLGSSRRSSLRIRNMRPRLDPQGAQYATVQQQEEQIAQKAQKKAEKEAKRPIRVQDHDDPTRTISVCALKARRLVQDPENPRETLTQHALNWRNFKRKRELTLVINRKTLDIISKYDLHNRKRRKQRPDASNCDTEINTKKSRQKSVAHPQQVQHAPVQQQDQVCVEQIAQRARQIAQEEAQKKAQKKVQKKVQKEARQIAQRARQIAQQEAQKEAKRPIRVQDPYDPTTPTGQYAELAQQAVELYQVQQQQAKELLVAQALQELAEVQQPHV